ncbi:AP2/B3-like transcriptional factor family protein, putative [Theobroma cacao]|uniref:AP2/B3-like transcriptional factor family protein, putative n=1 Tax=Theobroma cacao TaxID=3641 RepID=A0A061DHL4_THECC|nr:AP2/B3-like transcriptional factor family protein, putative [Theobroma cacao]
MGPNLRPNGTVFRGIKLEIAKENYNLQRSMQMVILQKSNDHPMFISESPHFFTIILPGTLRDGKLGIPTKFVKRYGNGMSSPALLRVPNDEVWKVEPTKCDGKVWLKNGWQEFSNHYSLEYGHFLVFRYEGFCNFHVVIFDRSASEIEYPYGSNNHRQHKELPEQKIEESEDADSLQILEDISPSRKTGEKSHLPCSRPHKMMRSANSANKTESNLKCESLAPHFRHNGSPDRKADKSTTSHRIKKLNADKKAKALQRARAFKSENPFFLLVMQPSYVGLNGKWRLAIPNNFVWKHLMKEDCEVILCNSNGKTWTVSLYRRGNGRELLYAGLQTGWKTFVKDNNIQIGDVCVFELINCMEISFKVTIYQGQTDVFRPVKRNVGASSTIQGDMSSLHNQHPTEEFPVPKIEENKRNASGEILDDILLYTGRKINISNPRNLPCTYPPICASLVSSTTAKGMPGIWQSGSDLDQSIRRHIGFYL